MFMRRYLAVPDVAVEFGLMEPSVIDRSAPVDAPASRVLLTNDDGIDGPGLHALAIAMADAGHEVIVVAPDRDQSGTGAALGGLGAGTTLGVARAELPGRPDIEAWALEGPPATAVLAAAIGAFGSPPTFVVSGTNAGTNAGRAVLHSGTVGAALTAQNFGLSGLAVSLAAPHDGEWAWAEAARLAVDVFERYLLTAPPRSVLNLNVPSVPPTSLDGLRWARLAPFGTVRTALADGHDLATGHLELELRQTEAELPPDTDSALLGAGYATLTTITGVSEAWPSDATPTAVVESTILPGAPVAAAHLVPDASDHRVLRRPGTEWNLPSGS